MTVDQPRLQVVVREGAFVARRAVAHLEVHDIFVRLVDEVMAIPRPGPEARTHAG